MLNRKSLYIIIAILSFALLGSLYLLYNNNRNSQNMIISADYNTNKDTLQSDNSKSGTGPGDLKNVAKDSKQQSSVVYVDVGGAVKNPGVYQFVSGDRVIDAIKRAGGLLADADTTTLNLAKKLVDEEKIYVPKKGEKVPTASGSNGAAQTGGTGAAVGVSGGKININTATLQELDSLPGIGQITAQRIIDYRTQNGPFKSIDEIKNVNRIGDKIFEELKDKITVN